MVQWVCLAVLLAILFVSCVIYHRVTTILQLGIFSDIQEKMGKPGEPRPFDRRRR